MKYAQIEMTNELVSSIDDMSAKMIASIESIVAIFGQVERSAPKLIQKILNQWTDLLDKMPQDKEGSYIINWQLIKVLQNFINFIQDFEANLQNDKAYEVLEKVIKIDHRIFGFMKKCCCIDLSKDLSADHDHKKLQEEARIAVENSIKMHEMTFALLKAKLYLNKKMYREAKSNLKLYKKAILALGKISERYRCQTFGPYYGGMALVSVHLNEPEKIDKYLASAEYCYERAHTYNINSGAMLCDSYKKLYMSYFEKGQFLLALKYIKSAKLFIESLVSIEKSLLDDKKNGTDIPNFRLDDIEQNEGRIKSYNQNLINLKSLAQCCREELYKRNFKGIDVVNLRHDKHVNISRSEKAPYKLILQIVEAQYLKLLMASLKKGQIKFDKIEGLIVIHKLYQIRGRSLVKVLNEFSNSIKKLLILSAKDKEESINSELSQAQEVSTLTTETVSVVDDITLETSKPYVHFDSDHDVKLGMPSVNVFSLNNFSAKWQYICYKPQLYNLDTKKEIDCESHSDVFKNLFAMCDRGKVLGNSKGAKGFIINGEKIKGKDSSKDYRFYGKVIEKREIIPERNEVLFEISQIKMKHT